MNKVFRISQGLVLGLLFLLYPHSHCTAGAAEIQSLFLQGDTFLVQGRIELAQKRYSQIPENDPQFSKAQERLRETKAVIQLYNDTSVRQADAIRAYRALIDQVTAEMK